ncbi:hypothetical protein VIBNISOn1_p0014 [Vibrio nigripulchritudo SOn1]|uniref:Transposase n=1 Tax=Vibrio nigripulchritudo SOn1 TaxID=1238450 RepID=A0AAV2W033_9VIBR|nr:hypothetical protein VIBNISOn1_p0014 [Vibrio nigripulchritudo SOn1]
MSNCSYFSGIDLAKNHFSIHVVDSDVKVILHKSVTHPKLMTTIANMPSRSTHIHSLCTCKLL